MTWATGIWAGFGFDVGGEIVVGTNTHTGALISIQDSLDNPSITRWCAFQQESLTLGAGLGGSLGTNFVIGYNAATPSDFDGSSTDFDFSIDLGLGKLDKYFRTLPEMIELMGIARKFDRTYLAVANAMKNYENSRAVKAVTENLVKNIPGIREALQMRPSLLSFPLPTSVGLRLSVKMKREKTSILSFDAMDLTFR